MTSLASNCMSTIVLDNQGALYALWTGSHPKRGSLEAYLPDHVAIANGVAAGHMHAGAVLTTGEIVLWGNVAEGQLGSGMFRFCLSPVRLRVGGPDVQIRSLACGAGHTLALDHRGRVWATGMSSASGFYQNRSDFALLPPERFVGQDVVAVRAGGWNSAAKTTDGALFTWGLGRYGAPGHGDTDDVTLPCMVDFLEDVAHQVVEFAVGWSFCVVATNAGLFSWGNNSAGQLGLGDMVSRTRPKRVLYWDAGRRIAQVRCGDFVTLILDHTGVVWSAGKRPMLIGRQETSSNNTLFDAVPMDDGVVEIDAGPYVCTAITETGQLVRWGVVMESKVVQCLARPLPVQWQNETVFGRWISIALEAEAKVAVAMGLHARLGAESWLGCLEENLLREIVQFAGSSARGVVF